MDNAQLSIVNSPLVPPGYKQTEVGVIPEDWKVGTLTSVSQESMQNGVFFEPARKGKGIRLINVGDLYTNVPINIDSLELFDATQTECERFRVADGDIFFTRSSVVPSGIAQCNIYRNNRDEPAVFDSHVIRLRPDIRKVIPAYLFRFCVSSIARHYLVSHAKTGTMTTIDQTVLGMCPVVLPPLAEQEAIAAALSDADALIEALEQLIAKKRQVKQGAMQELLTGKRRLPGFGGEWEVRRLGDVVDIRKGELITESEAVPGPIPVIAGGKKPAYFHNSANRWGKVITISGSGANAGYVSFFDVPIFASDCSTIGEGSDYAIEFIYFVLLLKQVQIYQAQTGGAQPHIHPNDLRPIIIGLPPTISEQTAIATILSDMDAEITALEEKLAKARQVKQGMMQELLTGRTRLIDNG